MDSRIREVIPVADWGILDKLVVEDKTGCWRWLSHTQSISFKGRMTAIKLLLFTWKYNIPVKRLRNSCGSGRYCVNPEHHEETTACPKGHSYTKENTYISKAKTRHCRTCHRETQYRYRNPTKKMKYRMLTMNGITKTLQEWSVWCGIGYSTIHGRLTKGWTVEKALTTLPVKLKRKRSIQQKEIP